MTKLKYPTKTKHRISSKYGNRTHPITSKVSFHNGVDLATPQGTELINTIAEGKCTKVGFDDINGHYLRILHDNEMLTSYAHLKEVLVKENDIININDVFALTGNTGASKGAHLHFRVRIKKGNEYVNVNPEEYFEF